MAEQIAHTKNEKIEQFGRICFYAGLLLELLIVILDKSSWINPLEGQMFRFIPIRAKITQPRNDSCHQHSKPDRKSVV